MKELREKVSIKTPLGIIHGELYVGRDHLPECEVAVVDSWGNERRFTPSSIPSAWLVMAPTDAGILYYAWCRVTGVMDEIARAQRRIEQEERDANG